MQPSSVTQDTELFTKIVFIFISQFIQIIQVKLWNKIAALYIITKRKYITTRQFLLKTRNLF